MAQGKPPAIGILYDDDIPEALIDEAADALETETFSLVRIKKPAGAIFLSLEWLVPTIIVGYVAKAYFDGFIGKLGEDHYKKIKAAFSTLFGKMLDTKVTVIASEGKASLNNPFSMMFSIEAEATPGLLFKLLIQKGFDQAEIGIATDEFLSFVKAFHQSALPQQTLNELEEYAARGSRILICFEPEAGKLRLVDVTESRSETTTPVYLELR